MPHPQGQGRLNYFGVFEISNFFQKSFGRQNCEAIAADKK
jgi:hypothetical protein